MNTWLCAGCCYDTPMTELRPLGGVYYCAACYAAQLVPGGPAPVDDGAVERDEEGNPTVLYPMANRRRRVDDARGLQPVADGRVVREGETVPEETL